MSRKKIAAIVTTFFPGSHADLLVSHFVKGFPTPSGVIAPKVDVVSMYMDQAHPRDIGVELARDHGIELFPSIRSALALRQPPSGHWPTAQGWEIGEMAVDGVLIIAEHGDYAPNERGRQMYPRRHFFEQVCGMIGLSGRPVPVFNDKHLAYSWDDARWMYDRAADLDIPFMAGSSLPVTGRTPELDHETGAPIDEALALGHFHAYPNGLDSYGFHGLEALQCMVERRRGGETGIAAVRCIEGRAVWDAAERGLWPRNLAAEAESRIADVEPGRMEDNCVRPALFELEYADGLRAFTLMLDRHIKRLRLRRPPEQPDRQHRLPHDGLAWWRALHRPGPRRTGDVPHRPAPIPRRAHPPHHRRPRRPNGLPPPRRHPHRNPLAHRGVHRVIEAPPKPSFRRKPESRRAGMGGGSRVVHGVFISGSVWYRVSGVLYRNWEGKTPGCQDRACPTVQTTWGPWCRAQLSCLSLASNCSVRHPVVYPPSC